MSNTFYNKIKIATQESHVQEVYNESFKRHFNVSQIERKYQCDGYFATEDNRISVLIEYKYDIQMKNSVQRSKAIAQCLGYLKKFEEHGERIPKLVFIGDINECLIIHTNDLLKYLDEDVDWAVSPCSMGDCNPNLILKLAQEVKPWVYDVNESFTFKDVADKITDLCNNVSRKLHITEKSIEKVYNLFCDRVIKDKKKVQANDLVSAFIGTMLDPEHYYQHPRKKNILVANDKQVAINGDQFELFMQMHSTEYSPKEKRIMTAISDRLIEDTNRRNKGEFYTPTLFVDYAHGMIEKELGSHWKDNYVVWDPAAGTLNLTRDYRFKELYCSTLEQAELDISKNYNKEATKFQFDFLNDSLDDLKVKAPGLLEAFELNKPIVFFLNPPYMTTSSLNGGVPQKVSSKINDDMKRNKMGRASQDLYNQFIYRITKIKQHFNLSNCFIGLFCKSLYMVNASCKDLRKYFLKHFHISNGIYFCANNFANVSSAWGISFTIWKVGEIENKYEFPHNIVEVDPNDNELKVRFCKTLYNDDNCVQSYKKWINLDDRKKTIEFPNWRMVGIVDESNNKITENYLGDLYTSLNSIGISTLSYYHAHDICLTPINFNNLIVHFSVNEIIENNWVTNQNPLIVPNTKHSQYNVFANDSLIISMFSDHSMQTSHRQIKYHNKLWDVNNEFFWMSKQEMLDLAEKYNNDYTYEDALNSEERFVYLKLQEIKDDLSPEAKAVLDKATDLVINSFKYREMFNESHPEYQINNWDCGFYQIKALLKEFMPNELKEFRQLYKQLADKMRPMVYELGFLRA